MSVRPTHAALVAVASVLAVALAPTAGQAQPAEPTSQVAAVPVTVVAAGDIACAPGQEPTANRCRQGSTAALTRQIDPDAVLALGDLQYPDGSLSAFRASYDKSWGTVKGRTHPVPGNHEYNTRGAAGYYSYMTNRQPGSPGYYARSIGTWRAYLLNSNCGDIDCDRQFAWLEQHLESNPTRCALFATHHPRYSSGKTDSVSAMRRFFRIAYRHRVELVLSGHAHHYERFRPMNGYGAHRDDGVTQIISGAGGASHVATGPRASGSVFINDTKFGVLKLTLGAEDYGTVFRAIDGTRRDAWSSRCR